MPLLRCERLADGDIDGAIAAIGAATLARAPGGRFIEVTEEREDHARRLLAYAGVRVTRERDALASTSSSRAAVGRDLAPLPLGLLALDLVLVRPLPLAEETRRLLRHRLFRQATAARRRLCRDLLRGEQIALGWRRRAWASREVLRAADVRRVLRPVVFDAGAVVAPPEHRLLADEGALARWLFG